MNQNFERGILIAIEGIDGAGKTTQVIMLRDALERAGESVVISKEPTDGQWGRLIKESASQGRMAPELELDMFIKDRAEHVDKVVKPGLEAEKVVILDRYFYSTIAYQGSRGANVDEVSDMMTSRFPQPDAVLILDVDPELSAYRIAYSRGEVPNHFEERQNLARARAIFNDLTGSTIHKIDGSMSREAVHSALIENLIEGALKKKRCAKSYGCDDPFHCVARILSTCEWVKLSRALRSHESARVSA